jgi:cell wall-associated NlpC family hydrolase
MIKIFIGLCAVLAVVMIVIGGIEYMTSELVSSKEAGKERIRGAIFGLLLALGAWTLLNQINPDILNTNLSSLQNVTVDVIVGGESSTPFGTGLNSQSLASAKINCSTNLETTANSFIGNSTYSQTYRNTVNPNGTVVVDCSSFVDQVYQCSKLPIPGSTTTEIFDTTKGATKITAQDLQTLKVGDLIGWKKGDTAGQVETDGHVMMYIGNGMIIDAMGGTTNGVTKRLLKDITAARLTYIKRIP